MSTVFYIGDSTVTFNRIDTYPQQGMSNALGLYLREGVALSPHGHNGRSTKSFLDEGAVDSVREALAPGDFLFIQFGHNDEKEDPARHTDPRTTFPANLRYFIRCAREAGAHPLLITPIARRLFDDRGRFLPGSHGSYPAAIRQVGEEDGVPVADLTAMTERYLSGLGDEPSKPLFVWPKDNTHLKHEGAVAMCAFLAEELKRIGGSYGGLVIGYEGQNA